jgi:hypothetical protein
VNLSTAGPSFTRQSTNHFTANPKHQSIAGVSRRGTPLTPEQREAVLLALTAGTADPETYNSKN